jgi:NitT/TauT family transport system substrate-binding protein
MRRWLVATVLLLGPCTAAFAADPLTLQLKWLPQAQFAGYYVAAEKGYYADASLNVTIKPGGLDVVPAQVVANGSADVVVDWLPSALAAREKGAPLVNIAQIFERSGMELTCRRDANVRTPADFRGKTLGVWYAGNEYPFLSWMSKLGLRTDGSPNGVTVLRQDYNIDPLLRKTAACISTMSYNEYLQVLEAGMRPEQLVVFKYEDHGVSLLEDGLYTTEAKLRDPVIFERLVRFVRASVRGWRYAMDHQAEAVKIVLAHNTPADAKHQTLMMAEIVKLLGPDPRHLGRLHVDAYDRTVRELLSGASDPVITRNPEGAWTHAVWDKALPHGAR